MKQKDVLLRCRQPKKAILVLFCLWSVGEDVSEAIDRSIRFGRAIGQAVLVCAIDLGLAIRMIMSLPAAFMIRSEGQERRVGNDRGHVDLLLLHALAGVQSFDKSLQDDSNELVGDEQSDERSEKH